MWGTYENIAILVPESLSNAQHSNAPSLKKTNLHIGLMYTMKESRQFDLQIFS